MYNVCIMGTSMISCVPSINGWPVGKCVKLFFKILNLRKDVCEGMGTRPIQLTDIM